MIIYESFLEKTLVRKLLGGLSSPRAPPLPTALIRLDPTMLIDDEDGDIVENRGWEI